MSHVYKDNYKAYLNAGYSVIPDKFKMKMPAIKKWADYCYRLPTLDEAREWVDNFDQTNMAVCLGEASGIIALDFDADDPKIVSLLEGILPQSPVGRVGAKGWARLFRYNGETSDILKYNGKVVLEILSNNKKVTLPPSVHPSDIPYVWENQQLLDVKKEDLPYLPPMLFSFVEQKLRTHIPDVTMEKHGKIISGRNDGLSSLCGTLIHEGVDLNEALKKLLDYDQAHNDPPLFTDINEMQHTEKFTNALKFYTNHLDSINTKRMRTNKVYEVPITAHAVDTALKDELLKKKEQNKENQREKREVLEPMGMLKGVRDYILSNSFIKQPELALSASLALCSLMIARKFTFLGNAPNLYLLNIAPSGSGKDAPQQCIKRLLIDSGHDHFLGGGDYVSDASLMDNLQTQPVRLDLIDEASGLLKTINKGKGDYSSKMADILCELYTTSNDKFLGRQTAEGRKGECYRPNVCLLMSTTPRGFEEGISIQAIEKGLLGRTLIFKGNPEASAERLRDFAPIDKRYIDHFTFWLNFRPETSTDSIGNISQSVQAVIATENANERLDSIFKEFDSLRRDTEPDSPRLPIISRLFQMLCKISLIHAFSRAGQDVPNIEVEDVMFAYSLVTWNYETFTDILENNIYLNNKERDTGKVLNIIRKSDGLSNSDLVKKTRFLKKKDRQEIISDLIEEKEIYVSMESDRTLYRSY